MAQVEKEQKQFSFGFSKRKEQKKLVEAAIKDDDVDKNQETEFVSHVEDKTLQSNNPKEEKKPLVIPMIQTNKWHIPTPNEIEKDVSNDSSNKATTQSRAPEVTSTGDVVTDQALQELVSDARKQNEEWDERGGVKDSNRAIPLLMRNKIPDGFETDDKLDVSLRPDEAAEADYEQIPIEEYGMALLRGMGFKAGEGLGKNKKSVAPIVAVARPKGLGLGADRSMTLQQKDGEKGGVKGHEEALEMKKGAFCSIVGGRNEGLYAKVEGIDEENARVVVRLAIGGNVVTLNQMAVRLVTKKDYDKNSKYLNKTKVDKYKEDERDREDRSHSHKSHNGHHRDRREDRHTDRHRETPRESHRDSTRHRERGSPSDDRKHGKYHRGGADSPQNSRHRKDRDTDTRSRRDRSCSPVEKKKKKKGHDKTETEPRDASSKSLWLRPHLKVRVIDPEFKKGKYYKSKVIIEDVISQNTCICKTEEGKVLEDLSQRQLETVIPKSKAAYIMVVSGRHKGKVGEIMEKDSSSCSAVVQILPDCDEILSLEYDVICEFAGRLEDLNL